MTDSRPTLELHPAGERGFVAEANRHTGARGGWHIPEPTCSAGVHGVIPERGVEAPSDRADS
jgi:hypothetical protein